MTTPTHMALDFVVLFMIYYAILKLVEHLWGQRTKDKVMLVFLGISLFSVIVMVLQ